MFNGTELVYFPHIWNNRHTAHVPCLLLLGLFGTLQHCAHHLFLSLECVGQTGSLKCPVNIVMGVLLVSSSLVIGWYSECFVVLGLILFNVYVLLFFFFFNDFFVCFSCFLFLFFFGCLFRFSIWTCGGSIQCLAYIVGVIICTKNGAHFWVKMNAHLLNFPSTDNNARNHSIVQLLAIWHWHVRYHHFDN